MLKIWQVCDLDGEKATDQKWRFILFSKIGKEGLRITIYFFPAAMIEKEGFQMNKNFKISTRKREVMVFVKM